MAEFSYITSSQVTMEEFDDETLLLDVDRDLFFRINQTGRLIWQVLSTGGTRNDAARKLVEHFGIERERADADVDVLIAELIANQLLVERG